MFLKNKNIIFKIRRLKVTDYAALSDNLSSKPIFGLFESGCFTQALLYQNLSWLVCFGGVTRHYVIF